MRFLDRARGHETARVACRCNEVDELYGREAEDYARDHLRAHRTDDEPLSERLSCPDTGRRWLLEYPERTDRDLRQARLRVEPP